MANQAETQEVRVRRVKAYLKSRPGEPCNFVEIKKATGVPKSRIDFEKSLSSDPEIRREEANQERGVRWTYIGPTNID